MISVGTRVRVASAPPRYSAFDGWIGTVESVHEECVLVSLDALPSGTTVPGLARLPFGRDELRLVAVPTARVGTHFPEYGQ